MVARPWTATADSVVVIVRLTPRGGRDAIDGVAQLADGRSVLKVRVRAAASEGEANAALMKLILWALPCATSASLLARARGSSICGSPAPARRLPPRWRKFAQWGNAVAALT